MANQYKLLDTWITPDNTGDPIGVIASTYTFDPVFFEEECLTRFLNIQSDPNTDGPIYLIEFEEKMNQVECVSVLIDQNHCHGQRNLHWDMVSARVKKGVQHSKIAVLAWSNCIRVIVASANITESGYCKNQEVFGVLEFTKDSIMELSLLTSILSYLKDIFLITAADKKSDDLQRVQGFIKKLEVLANGFYKEIPERKTKEVKIVPILIKPGGQSVLEQLREHWKFYSKDQPDEGYITSPFFNPPEDHENYPAQQIWELMTQRGKAKVTYTMPCESSCKANSPITLRGPETLRIVAPARPDIRVDFRYLKEMVVEKGENYRPVHLKTILLKNKDYLAYLIGSSNFTSAGLGLNGSGNFEANLVYLTSTKYPKHFRDILNSRIPGEPVKEPYLFTKNHILDEDQLGSGEYVILPGFFKSLVLTKSTEFELILNFRTNPPKQFEIYEENGSMIYRELSWLAENKPASVLISWVNKPIPAGLIVRWEDSKGKAYWPVIVKDRRILPPPEDIKNLPLEVLIQIITSARPVSQIIRAWLNKKIQIGEQEGFRTLIDPHKKVDTSSFILQRTRKVSFAMTGLKKRLEAPVYTKENLQWKLFGPIGVSAIADAILREAKSDEERAFLLCEIALELSRINYQEKENSIKKKEVKQQIKAVVEELYAKTLPLLKGEMKADLKDYIKRAFKLSLA